MDFAYRRACWRYLGLYRCVAEKFSQQGSYSSCSSNRPVWLSQAMQGRAVPDSRSSRDRPAEGDTGGINRWQGGQALSASRVCTQPTGLNRCQMQNSVRNPVQLSRSLTAPYFPVAGSRRKQGKGEDSLGFLASVRICPSQPSLSITHWSFPRTCI